MKISVIQNQNFGNSKNNIKNNVKANISKNSQTPNFKGYTFKTEVRSGYDYRKWQTVYYYNSPPNLQETGFKREKLDYKNYDREYDMKSETGSIPPIIYIGSPFEDIPEEIYKTHTHIQKNDMYLSQIRKDCKSGLMNFAENARCEIKHFEGLKDNALQPVNQTKNELENLKNNQIRLNKIYAGEKMKLAVQNDIEKKEIELQKFQEKLKQVEEYAENKLPRARKRFEVLEKMDELGEKIEKLTREGSDIELYEYARDSYYRMMEHKKESEQLLIDIEKKEKAFSKLSGAEAIKDDVSKKEKELNKLKENLKTEQAEMKRCEALTKKETARKEEIFHKEIPLICEEIDEYFLEIEKFYKENYPEWAD